MSINDVVVVAGTRPEAIKLQGIVRRLGAHARLVHTGQHYDAAMWGNVLADLPDVRVDHHIAIGGRCRGEQIGSATEQLSRYLGEAPCRALVVQGDTNSTLAGALAANAGGIPVIHVEAGLRSHDRAMPEEVNRILVDAIADVCCAPTPANADQLRREGVGDDRIVVTGNTLGEAIASLLPPMRDQQAILDAAGLAGTAYTLATIHRAGNVDDPHRLGELVRGLAALAERTTVVLPVHPRTAARMRDAGLDRRLGRVRLVEPLAPTQFITLEAHAELLLSDSGGVQEEACFLRRPLLVLRDSTERPELLDGWCRLLGDATPESAILAAYDESAAWAQRLATRSLPYPEQSASAAVVAEIDRRWPRSATSAA